jgi:hypothetical protein
MESDSSPLRTGKEPDSRMTAMERIVWERENVPFAELAKRQGAYMVVASPDISQLIGGVNKQLADGWEVAGGIGQGIVMNQTGQPVSLFMQAMVKRGKQ